MTITIRQSRSITGPNVWCREPVTYLLIDLGAHAASPADEVRRIATRVADLLVCLDLRDYRFRPLPPILDPGDNGLAAVFGTLILDFQRLAGILVEFSAARRSAGGEAHEVIAQHRFEAVGLAASTLAVRLLNHVISGAGPTFDPSQAFSRFCTVVSSRHLGNATQPIVAAAERRGIPVSRIDPSGRIIELGTGAHRLRFHGSVTSRTSKIADNLSRDKSLTNRYLRAAGLPVPDGSVVRTVDQAVASARAIGYPVVLKPVDFGASVGVSVDLRTDDDVRMRFPLAAAASTSGRVLVERYIAGNEYRIVIVNDAVVSVIQNIPASVVGDGRQTIRRLIETANADPRRGKKYDDRLREIVVDAVTMNMLERQHLELDAVPTAGQSVRLKPTGKVSGTSVDRTDEIHPDNTVIFRQAAQVVGLDVATMDVVAHDIAQSIWTTSGAIIEINTGSRFHDQLYPGEGKSRDPGPAIVDMLFPPGRPVRAPIIAVAGDADVSGPISQVIAGIMTAAGYAVGLAIDAGVFVAGTHVHRGDGHRHAGVQILLNNPATEIVVAALDPGDVLEHGLGFTYCDVAVITSLSGITTPFGLPIERLLIGPDDTDAVLVLNADDPATTSFTRAVNRSAVLFGLDHGSGPIRDHLARGGRAAVIRKTPTGDVISLMTGDVATDVCRVGAGIANGLPRQDAPLIMLAAASAAIARDVPIETIRRAMSTPAR